MPQEETTGEGDVRGMKQCHPAWKLSFSGDRSTRRLSRRSSFADMPELGLPDGSGTGVPRMQRTEVAQLLTPNKRPAEAWGEFATQL